MWYYVNYRHNIYLIYIYIITMKIAITGSPSLVEQHLEKYLPSDVTEIICCGDKGIDLCAKTYAINNNLIYREFLPNYKKYGKNSIVIRNQILAEYSDYAIIFWDGLSQETKEIINTFKTINKKIYIIRINNNIK